MAAGLRRQLRKLYTYVDKCLAYCSEQYAKGFGKEVKETFHVNIYIETDGAGVKKQYRGYGAIVEFIRKSGEPETRDIYGLEEATRNQIMLMALTESMKILAKRCDVTVYMDNSYVTESISRGRIYEWSANGWKTVKNEPIANEREWKELLGLLEKHDITFACVNKHDYQKRLQYDIQKIKNQGISWKQQRLN